MEICLAVTHYCYCHWNVNESEISAVTLYLKCELLLCLQVERKIHQRSAICRTQAVFPQWQYKSYLLGCGKSLQNILPFNSKFYGFINIRRRWDLANRCSQLHQPWLLCANDSTFFLKQMTSVKEVDSVVPESLPRFSLPLTAIISF